MAKTGIESRIPNTLWIKLYRGNGKGDKMRRARGNWLIYKQFFDNY